jgi:hypothetical protein
MKSMEKRLQPLRARMTPFARDLLHRMEPHPLFPELLGALESACEKVETIDAPLIVDTLNALLRQRNTKE